MPFNEPTTFSVDVLQVDIDNASAGDYNNSLAQALTRLNANKQLPGQSGDANPQTGCLFFATLSPFLIGVQVYLCQVGVCTTSYGADTTSALIIAAENLGIPPSSPYTVSLRKAG